MGRWGAVVAAGLVLAACLCAGDGVAILVTGHAGSEWMDVDPGNNTTGEPPWWVYAIIVLALAGSAAAIVGSTFYYRRERERRMREARRPTKGWKDEPRDRTGLLFPGLMLVIMCSFITLVLREELGLGRVGTVVAYALVLTGVSVPLIALSRLIVPLDTASKRTDKPLEDVLAVVDDALERRGGRYERMTTKEYAERGANEQMRKYCRWMGGDEMLFDVEGGIIVTVRQWGREVPMVDVHILYDGETTSVEGLKKDIEWDLR